MFERELKRFRTLFRERKYIISVHALEEMGEDDVLDEDIENVVLKGRIVERQLDRATKQRKYVLIGTDVVGKSVGVVLKMGSAGKAIVITVYREESEKS
jgi:hypothetical protein